MLMAGDGKKKMAAMIVAKFGPKSPADKNAEAFEERAKEPETGVDIDPGLLASAEEAMGAFERKDTAGFAQAMQSFFQQCDAMPHEEGPHEEEEEPSRILG